MQEGKLLTFVKGLATLLETNPSEDVVFSKGKTLLENLIKEDDWLPEEFCKPHPQYYQQYLLYADHTRQMVCMPWHTGQAAALTSASWNSAWLDWPTSCSAAWPAKRAAAALAWWILPSAVTMSVGSGTAS